ncbi:MAG: hypothetical protein KAY24_00085 [Candidatus Eisenbacteria sp.]|nr:hypothetical protein [Candidatus Eisenbacteria bacterium]
MAISTVASMASLFNLIYEDTLFVAREMNVMTNLVTPYSARGWMDRKIGIYPTMTAVAVAEGVDFAAPTTFTKTLQMTLSPGEVITQAILTDRRVETDPEDARRDCAQEMGNAISTKIDVDIVTDIASFTTDKGAGTGVTATIATFATAVTTLRAASVPNPMYAVLHPYHWHDIWTELGQPAATYVLLGDVANQALKDFFVGDWLNMRWWVCANIAVDATPDAVSGVFNPQALAFDSRKAPTMEPERDASLRAWELNMVAGYAHGVRRQTHGVKMTADATAP